MSFYSRPDLHAPKPNKDDPFENMIYKKYQQIISIFNRYPHKLVSREMQLYISMALVSIYIYLRVADLERIPKYADEIAKLTEEEIKDAMGDKGLKGLLRDGVVSYIVSLYEEFPLVRRSSILSFTLDCEIPDEDVEFRTIQPLKDSFCFKVNVHSKSKRDRALGVSYSKPYGLESDTFFEHENLKDFAMFLFLLTSTNAFSRRIVDLKNIKTSSMYDKREALLFGDLDKPIENL